MDASVLVQSYDSYGGHASISIIGDLLEHATKDLACGVAIFEATVCFRTSRPPKHTLETRQTEFHAELERLPRVRWEGKKRRLSLRYESHLGLAEQVLDAGPPSRALLLSALDELATVLKSCQRSLQRKPGLEAGSLVAMIESLNHLVRTTDIDLATFQRAHAERRRAAREVLPWWEQLEINWAEYHPAARELLDDPFFWSEADDFAPHGNDTGADLMRDFRTWRQHHRGSPPIEFLHLALHGWGFSTDWQRASVEEWDASAELAIRTHDEAVVALAFALIKLEGSCDGAVRTVALEAISRQIDPGVAAHFGWTPSPDREEALGKLRKALMRAEAA